MTRTATSTLALLLTLGFGGIAIAQETSTDTDNDEAMETEQEAEVGLEAGAEDFTARTGMTFDDVIADLQSDTDGAQAMTNLTNLSADVEVVTVRLADLRAGAGDNAAALDEMMMGRQAMQGDLRAAVEANATVRGALEAEGLMAENVVAVQTLADGRLVVIVDDAM